MTLDPTTGQPDSDVRDETDYIITQIENLPDVEFSLSNKKGLWVVRVLWADNCEGGGAMEVKVTHPDRRLALVMVAAAMDTEGLYPPGYMGPDFRAEESEPPDDVMF